jgi:hypothetical protein
MRFREFISQHENIAINQGDAFDIELDSIVLETVVSEVLGDGVLVEVDAVGLSYLTKFHLEEAEYQGRSVPLGKPMRGDVKKSKVYVREPGGRVVKVNFGDKKMRIKKSNPARRKSFRARHNCDNPGPRHKARYWSCRAW